ncbi:MAG: alpha-amylase family glycosyl hydrolase [Bacteroidota bacterium]|nr:alpha-amylase family glycosyl hydrolase [Bacteroidota bacterium]
MKKILLILVGVLMLVSAAAQNHPDWLKSAVFYQIYPSSFQDNDGNGIGDIKGIQSRLDYVQSLGVNAIWLNPIFKSAFCDGGYDVIDFYLVDPRFGTNTDLVELVKEVHKRGMHIVLDLVAGHSSAQNEWFKQSMEADANQHFSDYYIWTAIKPNDLTQQEASRWVEANAPRARYYIKNFYDCQPALNYGYANPSPSHPWEQSVDAPGPQAVVRELENIITFWLEKGIDGFRVDMASSLVKNDPDKSATIALWKKINGWFDNKFPEGVLIAEWFNPKQSIEGGFDIDFLRAGNLFSANMRGQTAPAKVYFDKAGEGSISNWYTSFKDQYESTLNKGYISVPTGNHDSPRIANSERNDSQQLKVAMTFFLTLPGIPFIYYGDEIGMRYIPNSPDIEGSRTRSGTRTPMQWDDSQNAGFSTAPKEKIYIPQDPDLNRPTVAKQDKDPDSQLNYVRTLLKLRASSAALGNDGEWKLVSDVNKPYPMVYIRRNGNEKYIIAINPSDKKVDAEFSTLNLNRVAYTLGTTSKCSYKAGKSVDTIKMPAVSAVIFKFE